MKIYEIITESTLEEGNLPKVWKVSDAKRVLTDLGYRFDRHGKGSHEYWKNKETGESFPLAIHGKEIEYGPSKQLNRIIRNVGYEYIPEGNFNEAVGLPSDTSTLLSLLSEMSNMLGAGGPQHDAGPLRSAVMQIFNNGSAGDENDFEKQVNFRTGSIRAVWMGKNWPQLKSCFLRLKKNPKYQRSINALNELGDWPVMLIKDPKNPSLSKYFSTILDISQGILHDMSRFEPEDHVRDRAMHLSKLIPDRLNAYRKFVSHWKDQYDLDSAEPVVKSKPKDTLPGQQAAAGQNIVDQVLSAIPSALAKKLRPEVQRMGSTNAKMMFLMKELQKAGIDPNKVLG